MTGNAFIAMASRSAVSPRGGALKSVEPHILGAAAVNACMKRAGLPIECVDEVIVSNVFGIGGNIARLIALQSGLPQRVPGLTVDRQCCGGLDALILAKDMIDSGRAKVILAGGVESYSLRPACYAAKAGGYAEQPFDQAPFTPWPEQDPCMHESADRLAAKLNISKREQDDWAIQSHIKAINARQRLRSEITTVREAEIDHDSFARPLSFSTCQRATVISGAITSANMSVAADGAAMCLVVTQEIAAELGRPCLEIVDGCTIGADPELPGFAPVKAVQLLFDRCDVNSSDLTVAEIMEAYAVQAIACVKGVSLSSDIVNPGGGSLARGHPIGASGAILAVRLFHELLPSAGKLGIAAIAAAGGLGTAILCRSCA